MKTEKISRSTALQSIANVKPSIKLVCMISYHSDNGILVDLIQALWGNFICGKRWNAALIWLTSLIGVTSLARWPNRWKVGYNFQLFTCILMNTLQKLDMLMKHCMHHVIQPLTHMIQHLAHMMWRTNVGDVGKMATWTELDFMMLNLKKTSVYSQRCSTTRSRDRIIIIYTPPQSEKWEKSGRKFYSIIGKCFSNS